MSKTWGDIFHSHLCAGADHGYAAHKADEWQRKQQISIKTPQFEWLWNEIIYRLGMMGFDTRDVQIRIPLMAFKTAVEAIVVFTMKGKSDGSNDD